MQEVSGRLNIKHMQYAMWPPSNQNMSLGVTKTVTGTLVLRSCDQCQNMMVTQMVCCSKRITKQQAGHFCAGACIHVQ